MRRKCPNCGKMPEIPEAGGYCTHCGAYIEGRAISPQRAVTPTATVQCPWEEMEKLGFFRALWDTLSGVLFTPTTFFSKMPVVGGIGRPLLFGLLVGSVGSIIGTLWQSSQAFVPFWLNKYPWFEGFDYEMFWPYWMSGPLFTLLMIFVTPMLVLLGIFIWAGIMHICLMIVGGAKKGFEATFRVVAYSEATTILEIIPFCGGLISFPWAIVVQIIGFKEAHGISAGKSILAVLLPLLFCCSCVLVALLIIGLTTINPEMF